MHSFLHLFFNYSLDLHKQQSCVCILIINKYAYKVSFDSFDLPEVVITAASLEPFVPSRNVKIPVLENCCTEVRVIQDKLQNDLDM